MALIAVWGGAFMYSLAITLSAPDRPLDFRYKSTGGELRLTAQSYAFDYVHGNLTIERPILVDPTGQNLASANYLEALNLYAAPSSGRVVSIKARGLKLRIVRLKNGTIPLIDYLPKQTEEPSNVPFHVQIDAVEADVVDLAGASKWDQHVSSQVVRVDGVGRRWVASGSANLPDVGHVSFSAQGLEKNGFLLRTEGDRLDLSQGFRHFAFTSDARRIPGLADFTADKLVASGSLKLAVLPAKRVSFESNLDVTMGGVQYRKEPRADSATFAGHLTSDGADGTLIADNKTAHASFSGAATWSTGIKVGGNFSARAQSQGALGASLQKLLPRDLVFNSADYRGWLGYDLKAGVKLYGDVKAASVSVAGETFAHPDVHGLVTRDRADADVRSVVWQGSPIRGRIQVSLGPGTLSGSFATEHFALATLAKRMNLAGLGGQGSVRALLSGTIDKPSLDLRATGSMTYLIQRDAKPSAGDFELAGRLAGGKFQVERAIVRSNAGAFNADGFVDVQTKQIALNMIGTGLNLDAFSSELSGTGALTAEVEGSVGHPLATGRAELFGVSYRDWQIPVLSANFRADQNSVNASDILAESGASQAKGNASLVYKTGSLAGTLSAVGLQLNDVFKSGVTGTIDLTHANLSGTTSNPVAYADVSGQTIVVGGVEVDRASARVTLHDKQVEIAALEARAANGTLKGSGSYNMTDGSGTLDATLAGLSIGRLLPDVSRHDIVADGLLSGNVKVDLGSKGLISATGEGSLEDVVLNQTSIGAGPWQLTTEGDQIRGSLQVGELDRFVELNNVAFNRKTQALTGDFDGLQVQLSDIYKTTSPYLTTLSQDTLTKLSSITGTLDAKASFAGTWPNLDFQVPSLTVASLALGDRPMGTLTSAFSRKGSDWSIQDLSWTNADSALSVRGRINPEANIALDGELSKFDLTNLSLIDARLGGLSGAADVSFLATGPAKSPEIDASLKSDRFLVGGTGSDQRLEFGMLLNAIHIEESHQQADGSMEGGIQAEGEFRYRGIVGQITSQIPFSYGRGIVPGAPLTAQIEVPNRQLSTLTDFYSDLDAKRTKGTIQGLVKVSGPVDALRAEGKVAATADVFAVKGFNDTLNKANAQLSFADDQLQFTFSGTSSAGGSANVEAHTHLQDFGKILSSIAEGNENELMSNVLAGSAELNGFRVNHDAGRDNGSIDVTTSAKLALTGTIARPAIKGSVAIDGTNILLPGKPVEASPARSLPINPSFDVTLATNDLARVRTSSTTLDLSGTGRLTGTLSNPDLTADMRVSTGTLRLPTARVDIQPDGTLKLLYLVGPAGDVNARMDVNLEGQTYLTTLRFGDTIEHYQITLGVRGDLFKEGGLQLTASSDPPDLSQDRILALLGQTDVLQAFNSGVSSQDAQKQIRTALTGIAVPVLFDPITSRLASSLGLQYLNVEFNAYEQATFAFAKVLGRDFLLQGRRQISEPTIGSRPTYDVRLTYRLPVSKGVLNRTTFSIGADQDRPWKIAIEYGLRF